MTRSNSVLRLAILSVAFALAAGVASTTARAKVYSLGGDARLQRGNWLLPTPAGVTPIPHGRIKATPGAMVFQTAGPDPVQMTIPPAQLQNVVIPVIIGGVSFAPAWLPLFQLQTCVGIKFPGAGIPGGPFQPPGLGGKFRAGGRTGPPTVTFCANYNMGALPGSNPACPSPMAGSPIYGLMRYTKTANQFGGPAQHAATGTANFAVVVGTRSPPCAGSGCTAGFFYSNPAPIGAQGGFFGFQNFHSEPAPSPNGRAIVSAESHGFIVNVTSPSLGPGYSNTATSFGGPWTTGMLTVQVSNAIGPAPWTFIFSGMDSRVNGIGKISLVSGSITARSFTGAQAGRGWLNLEVRNIPIPAVSHRGLAAAFGLLGLTGAYALRRWLHS